MLFFFIVFHSKATVHKAKDKYAGIIRIPELFEGGSYIQKLRRHYLAELFLQVPVVVTAKIQIHYHSENFSCGILRQQNNGEGRPSHFHGYKV